MITKQKVVSSQLKEVEYDTEKFILTVTFMNDKRYEYYDVFAQQFRDLVDAPSVGSHFIRVIKKGDFKFKAI